MTHSSTWKQRERDAAALFDSVRTPLSGSNSGITASDSLHPELYIETKLRAKSSLRSLWANTAMKAAKEEKVPILVIYDKGKHGGLIVVHQDDLEEFIRRR